MSTPEEDYEASCRLLRMAVNAGKIGIFTPDTLKALVTAADAVLAMYEDPEFRAGAIDKLRERAAAREAAPAAPVIDLFGAKKGGDA